MTSPNATVAPVLKTCKKGLHQYLESKTGCPECRKKAMADSVKKRRKEITEKQRNRRKEMRKTVDPRYLSELSKSRERTSKHARENRERYVWKTMINRCHSPKTKSYPRYGGRGISVCDRWRGESGYKNFLEDMGKRPTPDHSIERDDNNGNYEPANCRWATREEQASNKSNNRQIVYQGRTQTMAAWAREFGMKYSTLFQRIVQFGWDVERAMSERVSPMDFSSHQSLVDEAVQWLKMGLDCTLITREIRSSAHEVPDAIGWRDDESILIECKTRRVEFFPDRHKPVRRNPESGMGKYRYYMVPAGMLGVEEVPERWGLLYVEEGVSVAKMAVAFDEWNKDGEAELLEEFHKQSDPAYNGRRKKGGWTTTAPTVVSPGAMR